MVPDEDNKQYWENWLGEEYSEYLIKVREAVKRKYTDPQEIVLPFYTPHGEVHCKAVEDLMHRLIPKERYMALKERERFYLLASAWLHDIGMLRSVSKAVWGEELESSEIRKRHHVTAHRYINDNFHDCGLEEKDKSFIAQLCLFHRKQMDMEECDEELPVGNVKYRLRLLAAYLRLADALQIDSSRTPASAYAICLAYDIPSDAKLHWIKSKLVCGVPIDADNHVITIYFRIPKTRQLEENAVDPAWVGYKIDNIIKYVMDDLRDELSSVMYVLTRAGITYYLDVEKIETKDYIDNQALNDLLSLVLNFDILVAPSASKLLEMILTTTADIAGYHLKKNDKPAKMGHEKDMKRVSNELQEFLENVKLNVLAKRSCHLGLRSLLDRCDRAANESLPRDPSQFIGIIDDEFQRHHRYRHEIRKNSKAFFSTYSGVSATHSSKDGKSADDGITYNLLLFGYSELVIKAICGFRDCLISRYINLDEESHTIYNSPLEESISDKFRIFICEGQPKTQTAWRDRLLYHDGYSYALALAKRKFTNLVIIPDIVAGNIIENNCINLVMVGANGFTEKNFKHSGGHGSIINLVNEYRSRTQNTGRVLPRIVLVVSTNKYSSREEPHAVCAQVQQRSDQKVFVEGYCFWKGLGNATGRDNIWISRDKNMFNEIQNKRQNIMFYNPREDVAPIEYLDYIISNIGHFPISSNNNGDIKRNIESFISKLADDV